MRKGRTKNNIKKRERIRGIGLRKNRRRHDGGRGRDSQTNSMGLLKSTTTRRRGIVLRKNRRRHNGGRGRDPQTNSIGLLKSLKKNTQ